MPQGDERQITVRARCDASQPDGYRFELLENGQPICDGHIVCAKNGKMKKDDYHKVVFTLDNEGTSLRFAPSKCDAMWVTKKVWPFTGCPRKGKWHKHVEVAAEPSHTTLVVHNYNPEKAKYPFTLNFIDTLSNKMVPFDPIWENKNGGLL